MGVHILAILGDIGSCVFKMSGGSPAGSASGGGAPPEGMVSSQANGNGGSNLLTDFGSAYEEAMGTLTKEDNVFDRSPETMQQELETKILRMSEMARKLETFFCQRRFLLHSHKPEYLLREDCQEIRQEILRKDELIRRHGDKLSHWQTVLSDMQGGAAAAAVTASPASDQQPQQQQPPPPNTTTVGVVGTQEWLLVLLSQGQRGEGHREPDGEKRKI